MNQTKIEWCTRTLNPVVGCRFGCEYCYARKLNQRFGFIPNWNEPQFFPERLKQINSKKPQNIFMDSMSDIADWKDEWINAVAVAIKENPQHNYLFLTKRPEILIERFDMFVRLFMRMNVWIGVSITNNQEFDRLYELTEIRRRHMTVCHLFISFEPLHEQISIDYLYLSKYIDWIIVGAETGNRKEKIVPENWWTDAITYKTRLQGIPLFFKESMLPIMGEKLMSREFPKELIL